MWHYNPVSSKGHFAAMSCRLAKQSGVCVCDLHSQAVKSQLTNLHSHSDSSLAAEF